MKRTVKPKKELTGDIKKHKTRLEKAKKRLRGHRTDESEARARSNLQGSARLGGHIERGDVARRLSESNERMVNILESISDGFFSLDNQMVVTYYNRAAERLLGRTRAQVLGKKLSDAFPEAKGSIFERNYAEAIRDKKPMTFEVHFDVKPLEGWYQVRVFPFKEGISVYFQVTTERKEVEKKLAHLASFPELNPNPVIEVSSDGCVHYLNPAAQKLFPDLQEMGHRHEWLADLKTLGSLSKDKEKTFYVREIHTHGVWFEQFFSFAHEQDRIRIYGRDITERKRAEQALEAARTKAVQEKNRLETVMEALSVGVSILDAQGGIIQCNSTFETIWGDPRPTARTVSDYAAYKAWWADTGKPVQPDEWASARAVQKGETVIGQLMEIERFDGTRRFVMNSGAPLRNADNDIVGSAVVIQDITGQKQSEEALKKARERFELLSETASRLLATDKPQEIVSELCQKVMVHLDCHACFNYLVDEEKQRLHLNAYSGIPEETANQIEWLEYGVAVCGCAARDACRIVAEDIPNTQDPRTDLVKSFGIKAHACYPLFSAGRVIGTLSFGSRSKTTFSEEELSLMNTVADQVAMAMERVRLLEAARRRADELDTVFNAMAESVVIYDSNGIPVKANPAARSAFGVNPANVDRKAIFGQLFPKLAIRHLNGKLVEIDDLPSRKALRGEKVLGEHFIFTNAEGKDIIILVSASPLFTGEEISGAVAVWNDVTEREQLLEQISRSRDELEIRVWERTSELAKTSELLETVFSGIDVSIAYMDKDFNFIRVNRAYAEADEREPEFYVGKNHFTLFPNEENEKIFRKVVETGETYSAYAKPFGYAEHPERGVTYWDWSLQPVKEIDGSVGGVVLSLVDVTERIRAQESMSRNEALLRTVFETLPVGIWLAEKQGRIIHGNPAGQKIWMGARYVGIDQYGEYKGWWVETGKRIEAEEWAVARAVRHGETSINEEIEIECFDGSHKIILNSAVPIRDEKQEIIGAFIVNQDISERRQAQKAAEAERQRFNDVLEILPVYLVLLTPDYHVRFANRFFRERFGESGGRRCFEYLFGRNEPCEPCESYTPLKTQASHKWEWTGPDNRNYHVFDFPFADTDGSTLILEMGIDVTERKQAEEALKTSSLYARSLIEASLDPLVTISADGKITDVNMATELVTGVSRENLIGSDFSIYFTEPEKARVGYETVFSKGSVRDYPLAIRHMSGAITDVLYNATIYKNEAGQVQGVFAAARDITEQKKAEKALKGAEERLRQMQKMEALGTLAGGIAHDFNNILMPIVINTELALFDVPSESPVGKSLQLVLNAANRGKEMVKQITTFSRMKEQERKPIKIAAVVKEALAFLKSSFPKHIEIQDEIKAESSMVASDPTQIHQVLMNLCGNAADAMREKGGLLRVTLEEIAINEAMVLLEPGLKAGPYVKLTVSDTGTGMTSDVIGKVFDPFFTTKDPVGGTGMGLAVVHGIVKNHSGVVRVSSEVGKGSAFTVYLPRVKADSVRDSSDESPIPIGNETILVVDDEEYQVQSMRDMLERLGYHVTGKTRSLEALELFRKQPGNFDLVITDEVMPGITGSKLAEELLKIRPDLPIILCTGYSEMINRDKTRKMGIRELMMKPFGVREIATAIRRALKR